MNSNFKTIVISGSSTTEDTPWPTWATWATSIYNWTNVVNKSAPGLGNEVIILKALHAASISPGPVFLIVQLTSVDKWDWYVDKPDLVNRINKEKHPIIKFDSHDESGFWCTGSWFPLWKQHYQENYLSVEYQCYHTLKLLSWFQMCCKYQGWEYQIIFDSPLLAITEKDLSENKLTIGQCNQLTLTNNTLCQTVLKFVNLDNIYLPGIIGHSCINNKFCLHPKFGSHPGSLRHLEFVEEVLIKSISKYFNIKNLPTSLVKTAKKYQKLVEQ